MKHQTQKSSHAKMGTLLNKRSTSYGQVLFQGHAHLKKRKIETIAFLNVAPALNLSPGLWTTFFLMLQLSACAAQVKLASEQPEIGPALRPKPMFLDNKLSFRNETFEQQAQGTHFFAQKNDSIQPWLTQCYLAGMKKNAETRESSQVDKTQDIERLKQDFLLYDRDLLNLKNDLKKFEQFAYELKNTKTSQIIQNEWANLQRSVIWQIFTLNEIFLKKLDEISKNFSVLQNEHTAILRNGFVLNSRDIENMMVMYVSKLRHFMMENLEHVKQFERIRENFCDGLVIQLQERVKESKMLGDPLFEEITSTFYKNYEVLLQALLEDIRNDRSGKKISIGLEQKYLEYTEQISKLDYDLQFEIMEIVKKLNPHDQTRIAKKLQAAHDYSDNFFRAIIVAAIAIIGFPLFNFLKAKKNDYDLVYNEKQKNIHLERLELLKKEISKISNKINKSAKKIREIECWISSIDFDEAVLSGAAMSIDVLKSQMNQITGQFSYFLNLDLELESDLKKIEEKLNDFLENEHHAFNENRKRIIDVVRSKVSQRNEKHQNIIFSNNNDEKLINLDRKINVLKSRMNDLLKPSQILTINSAGDRYYTAYITMERVKNRLYVMKERIVFNRDLHKKWNGLEIKFEYYQKLLDHVYALKNNIIQVDIEMLREDVATLNQMQLEITHENYEERVAQFSEIYNKKSPDYLKSLQKEIASFEEMMKKIKTSNDKISTLAQQLHIDMLKQEVDPEIVNKSFRR